MATDESSFPTNHNAEMGVDPAIERAHAAGNLPPDPVEPTTILSRKLREALGEDYQ